MEVVFVNGRGVAVAEGICRNTHLQNCIDENPFGNVDVGIVIFESFIHSKVDPTHKISLRKWPLRNVTIEGIR